MNKYIKIFSALMLISSFITTSCSSEWDEHYDEAQTSVDAGSNVVISNATLAEFLGSADDLQQMYSLLIYNQAF